ncbi:addiction module toxin, HicA family [archaeon]|nr:addiction module toxin, HicA family [archaeon]
MKRRKLVDYLTSNRCIMIREGNKHTIFFSPVLKRTSSVTRHTEINGFLARKICKDLGIKEL